MDCVIPARIIFLCAVGVVYSTLGSPPCVAAGPSVINPARVIECRAEGDGRPTVVTGVALTPNGQTVVAATDDHTVSLWDADTGELQHRFVGHGDWVRAVAISTDGLLVASGANDHTVCLWDLARRERLSQLPACEGAIACVRAHANGQQFAVVGLAESLQIVNVSSGQITQRHDCAGDDQRAVAFSPDGIRLAAAGRKGRIRIWNVAGGAHERDVETGGRPIRTLDFSPDGRTLVAAGDAPNAIALDTATGQTIRSLNVRPAKVYAAVFIDNQQIATAGSDNRIRIWNLQSGELTAELVGHTGTVAALGIGANGQRLVSGSYDTTVRVWNLTARTPYAAEVHSPTNTAR
jgi:WD40 repeat protein